MRDDAICLLNSAPLCYARAERLVAPHVVLPVGPPGCCPMVRFAGTRSSRHFKGGPQATVLTSYGNAPFVVVVLFALLAHVMCTAAHTVQAHVFSSPPLPSLPCSTPPPPSLALSLCFSPSLVPSLCLSFCFLSVRVSVTNWLQRGTNCLMVGCFFGHVPVLRWLAEAIKVDVNAEDEVCCCIHCDSPDLNAYWIFLCSFSTRALSNYLSVRRCCYTGVRFPPHRSRFYCVC